jgi:hypothetical protein
MRSLIISGWSASECRRGTAEAAAPVSKRELPEAGDALLYFDTARKHRVG